MSGFAVLPRRSLLYALLAVIGVLVVALVVVVANLDPTPAEPAPSKPPCQAYVEGTAQEPVARLLLDARREADGIGPAARVVVLAYAEQIRRLCGSSGYASLPDGTVQAADALYTLSPETWQQ